MESFIAEVQIPEPSATPLERLRFLVNASRRSQAQFSSLIGIDPSAMSRLLSGRMPITDQFVNRLVVNLGISKQWFTTGQGVPFPRVNEVPGLTGSLKVYNNLETGRKGAPVYDIDATAGATPLTNMFADEHIIGRLDIPKLSPVNPVVRVSGNSMEPTLPNGAWISIREIQDPSIIMWGNIYLVVLNDYRMVKVVRRHPSDPSMIVLHSVNSDYDDIEVPRKAVLRMFLVENVIKCIDLV